MDATYQIITFYEFKNMTSLGKLEDVRAGLRSLMHELSMVGTIILADEGFNATVAATPDTIVRFVAEAEAILQTRFILKSSFNAELPFRRVDVKIKPEIVTLKQKIDLGLSRGTQVGPADWNSIIARPDVVVLDARNSYEYKSGTFQRAVDPGTEKFSDLPSYVEKNLSPDRHKAIAMFCTGGIRCEKLAPYVKSLGFDEVYQLEGGILRYLGEITPEQSKWNGECFVFDDRRTVDEKLAKGSGPDHSQKEPFASGGNQ